jgi:hypothetical protein
MLNDVSLANHIIHNTEQKFCNQVCNLMIYKFQSEFARTLKNLISLNFFVFHPLFLYTFKLKQTVKTRNLLWKFQNRRQYF